jgi:hypothetical protein
MVRWIQIIEEYKLLCKYVQQMIHCNRYYYTYIHVCLIAYSLGSREAIVSIQPP